MKGNFIVIDDYKNVELVQSKEHKKFMEYWHNKKSKINFGEHTKAICMKIDSIIINKHLTEPMQVRVKGVLK